jgi:hypothetical protein
MESWVIQLCPLNRLNDIWWQNYVRQLYMALD